MTAATSIASARGRRASARADDGGARSTPKESLGLATWIVLAYLLVDYGRPWYFLPVLEYLKLGVWPVLLGLYVLFLRRPHPLPREGWALVAFLFLMAFGVPFSQSPRITLDITQTMAMMMVAGPLLMMVGLDSIGRLRHVLWFYVVLAANQAIEGMGHGGHGYGGYFIDENDNSMFLATAIPITYFLLVTGKTKWAKLVGYAVFVLCALGIIVGFSRGGFLALCAAGLYIIVRSRHPVRTLFTVLLVVGLIFPFIPAKWYSEMQTIESSTQKGDTGEMRLYMWGVARRVFYAHPVMGVGAANFGRVAQDFQDPEQAWARGLYLYGYACHSIYFTMLAEMGVTGMAVFVTLLYFAFSTTSRVSSAVRRRMDALTTEEPSAELDGLKRLFGACRGLEGGMIAYLVAATFLTVNYYPECWTLAGLMAATGLVLEQDPAFANARA